MIADDELHDYFTQLIGGAGALLYGRTSRHDFPWNNTFRVEGELHDARQGPKAPEIEGRLGKSP